MPLFFFLIFIFIFPWFFMLLLLIFLVLIPLGFSIQSFLWVVAKPSQLFRIFSSSQVRKNHALAHGTINVLEEEYGILNIEGMPVENGFSLRGALEPDIALEASRSALNRIQEGELSLAFYKRCGITVLLVNVFFAFTLFFILRILGVPNLLTALMVLITVYFAGSRLSLALQMYTTISSDLRNLDLLGVDVKSDRFAFGGMSFMAPTSIFIRTRRKGAPVIVEVVSP